MEHVVSVIVGDGVGREVVPAALRVLEATGVKLRWEYALAGEEAFEKLGDALPEETIESIKKNKVALKGPLTNIVAGGYPGPNRGLRRRLGLFAAIKRAKGFEGLSTRYPGVDLVVIREVREDTYAGAEQQVGPDAAIGIKFITRENTRQVTRFAMEFTRRHHRKKVTVIHKATSLKLTDGLFLKAAQEAAEGYPDIEFGHMMVDNAAYQLVRDPWKQDVILAPNVYGDIFADLAAGLAGSLGLGYGGNFNDTIAMFEPIHGTAPKYAGRNIANPIGTILSGAMLLEHLGEARAALAIERAVGLVLKRGKVLTQDLGGDSSLSDLAGAVIDALC